MSLIPEMSLVTRIIQKGVKCEAFVGLTTRDQRREVVRASIRAGDLAGKRAGKYDGKPLTFAAYFAKLYGEKL